MDLQILTHEIIPKPLHGVAPRVMKKSPPAWWKKERERALAQANLHCQACGVHRARVPYGKSRLEVHEQYTIDHAAATMTYRGSVAICRACHAFIHVGRLYSLFQEGTVSKHYFETVMNRGFGLLRGNNIRPAWSQAYLWLIHKGLTPEDATSKLKERGITMPQDSLAEWHDWRLRIIDEATGEIEEYPPLHRSEKAWAEHYAKPTDA